MKRSVCPLLLMLIYLFALQSPKLHANSALAASNHQEYSVGERIYIATTTETRKVIGHPDGAAGEYHHYREDQFIENHAGHLPQQQQQDYNQAHLHQQQQMQHQQKQYNQQQTIHHQQYSYPPEHLSHQNHQQHIHHSPHQQQQQHHHQQQHSKQEQHALPQQQQHSQIHQQIADLQPQISQQPQQQIHSQQFGGSPLQQTNPNDFAHHPQHNDVQQQQQQIPPNQDDPAPSKNLQSQLEATAKRQQFHYTQIEWRHESTDEGEMLSEFFMQNYESTYPMVMTQDELEFYQYHQQHQLHDHPNNAHIKQAHMQNLHQRLHQRHVLYSRHISHEEQHDLEAAQQYYYDNSRPSSSCEPIDSPSMLMMPITLEGEPTCRATSTHHPMGDASNQASNGNVPNLSHYNNKPSHNSNVESFPLAPHHYHYESSLMAAIRHYWREVSGLCLASAIFLNWLFVVVKRRFIPSGLTRAEHAIESIQSHQQQQQQQQQNQPQHQRTRATKSLSKDTNSGGSAHDSAFEENASPISLMDDGCNSRSASSSSSSSSSKGSSLQRNGLNAQACPLDPNTPILRQRSSTLKAEQLASLAIVSSSPSGHNSLSTTLSNGSEYNSRYSSDFDSIQRLGRGGFGIVFEARNKIDDCHYAVKRICLPLEKEARERVMREVRALAKLDHVGIVRYYNAWLEAPPDEWLKQHDAQLGIVHSKDGMSFPSTDGIYDRNESENVTKGDEGRLLGESGDSSFFGMDKNNPFGKRRPNGYSKKLLRNNSSSPSLDIVFEGSGSIRLEAENTTEKTDSNKKRRKSASNIRGNKNSQQRDEDKQNGDNNHSDSEDSDFIQFESRAKKANSRVSGKENVDNDNDDGNGDENDDETSSSMSSNLTEPFSSSDSDNDELGESCRDKKEEVREKLISKQKLQALEQGRKRALTHQKEMRQLAENLHVEKVYLYIQMQLCRKDTLKDWLKTNCETRDKTTIFDLFYQIVDAVEYVHSQDLIHRDLKPSNIFFSLDGTLKIGDFGLCRAKTNAGVGSSLDLQEYVAESDVERGFEAVHTEQVGTQLYMSPEQLNGLSYNQKVDIFAMGLILLELLVPFKTQMQRVNVLFKARNNLYSDDFKADHPREHELVKSLLNRSPQKRPTANEIKQHELLASAQLSQPVIERIYHRRRTISSNSSTE